MSLVEQSVPVGQQTVSEYKTQPSGIIQPSKSIRIQLKSSTQRWDTKVKYFPSLEELISTSVVINLCLSDTSDFTHLCWIAVRIAAVTTPLNRNGSRRFDHFDEWLRKNGCRAAAWYQRTSKSGSGSSRNPPTSAATKSSSHHCSRQRQERQTLR